jgi:hypothetical protein
MPSSVTDLSSDGRIDNMTKLFLSISVACLALALNALAEESPVSLSTSTNQYNRLLSASKLVENYKEMASVSARVFAARAQGSDKEYAKFMKVISTADLSDIDGCLVNLYPNQGLTEAEATEVSSFFESSLGTKILRVSQQMLIGDIERGYHVPPPTDILADEERQKVKDVYQNTAFNKYNRTVASREFSSGITRCLAASRAVQRSGIKF